MTRFAFVLLALLACETRPVLGPAQPIEKFEAWFAPHFDRVNEACTPSSVSSMRELLRAAYRVGHRDGLDEALQKVVESLAKAET